MRRLLALTMCAVSLGATAQIEYPYNPDGNADSLISVPDIQDFLAVYGTNFVPDEIMVGDSTLSSWILSLSETASQQAAMISSLSELLNEQATIIDSLMDDGDEVHMFSIDSIQSGDWITIASVGDLDQVGPNLPPMRADALFDFTYNRSSGHQRVQVKVSHLFGKSNQLDIEHNRFYDNGSAISAFRIAFDNTYDGAVLQMRIQQPTCCQSVPVVMRIANNRNVPGWVVNPQILSNSVTSDNQPMVYGQVSDVVPFTQFYPSEAGTSLLEGDRTQAYMNTELHVNDLIVHGELDTQLWSQDSLVEAKVVEILNGLGLETCNPTFTDSALVDIQGNVYRSVQIGSQEWLAEPYRCTAYSDGTPITYTSNIYSQDNGTYEPTTISNADTSFSACFYAHDVARSSAFPPAGWRLPTPSDLQILIDNNGGSGVVGGKMKDVAFGLWDYPNTDASNCIGFGALPFGFFNSYGVNQGSGEQARYCLKQGNEYGGTWYFRLYHNTGNLGIFEEEYGGQYGLVRFVKE